jgi:hypothetical protein
MRRLTSKRLLQAASLLLAAITAWFMVLWLEVHRWEASNCLRYVEPPVAKEALTVDGSLPF